MTYRFGAEATIASSFLSTQWVYRPSASTLPLGFVWRSDLTFDHPQSGLYITAVERQGGPGSPSQLFLVGRGWELGRVADGVEGLLAAQADHRAVNQVLGGGNGVDQFNTLRANQAYLAAVEGELRAFGSSNTFFTGHSLGGAATIVLGATLADRFAANPANAPQDFAATGLQMPVFAALRAAGYISTLGLNSNTHNILNTAVYNYVFDSDLATGPNTPASAFNITGTNIVLSRPNPEYYPSLSYLAFGVRSHQADAFADHFGTPWYPNLPPSLIDPSIGADGMQKMGFFDQDRKIHIIERDIINNKIWSIRETIFDDVATERVKSIFDLLDNGTSQKILYDLDNLERYSVAQIVYDAQGRADWMQEWLDTVNGVYAGRIVTDWDQDNASGIIKATQVGADGVDRITFTYQWNDNGQQINTAYNYDNTQKWTSYQVHLDAEGRQDVAYTVYDDGTRQNVDFDQTGTLPQQWTRYELNAQGVVTNELQLLDGGGKKPDRVRHSECRNLVTGPNQCYTRWQN